MKPWVTRTGSGVKDPRFLTSEFLGLMVMGLGHRITRSLGH